MPKFTATIELLKFDGVKFTEAVIRHIEENMKLASKEFAKAALARIPIRTGFVAGSFGTPQALLGSGARLNPIVGFVRKVLASARKFLSSEDSGINHPQSRTGEYYYPPGGGRVLKTSTSGQQFTTPTAQIIQRIEGSVVFTFDVDITYFRINDNFSGRAPTAPWRAFEAGQRAFLTYMETKALDTLPTVEQFITKTTIRI